VFRGLDWEDEGFNVQGKKLSNLRFADDLVILSDNMEELQNKFQELIRESEKAGLTTNIEKSKLLKTKTNTDLIINNEPVETVEVYKYLGQRIATKNK